MPPNSTVALVQAAFALILVIGVDTFVTLRRIVVRLKSEHHVLWLRLGSPEAFTSLMATRADFAASLAGRTTLTLWLSRGEYLDLNDPIITKLARRRKLAQRAAIAVLIASLLAYAWLHRYD